MNNMNGKVLINQRLFEKDLQKVALKNDTHAGALLERNNLSKATSHNLRAMFVRFLDRNGLKTEDYDEYVGMAVESTFLGYCLKLGLKADKYYLDENDIFKKEPEVASANSEMPTAELDNKEVLNALALLNENIVIMNANMKTLIETVNDIGKLTQASTDNLHNTMMNTRQLIANTKCLVDIWNAK